MPITATLQRAGLIAHGGVARTGIMKQRWARCLFLPVYSAYKTWVESGPVDRLRDFVEPGSTVVNVRANVGFFTLKSASWVGERGKVIAIEPDLENFETLAAKVGAGGLERRVRLHHAAASAEAGFVHLLRNEPHPGDHRSGPADGTTPTLRAVTGLMRRCGSTRACTACSAHRRLQPMSWSRNTAAISECRQSAFGEAASPVPTTVASVHGFLSFLVKTAMCGKVFTVFGYKGKQVREQIHSIDVVRAFEAFIAAPRIGEVYNLGGGRESNASILECFEMIEAASGRKVAWRYDDRNRAGDHICYIFQHVEVPLALSELVADASRG